MSGRSPPIAHSRIGPRSFPTPSTRKSSPRDSPNAPSISSSRKASAQPGRDHSSALAGEVTPGAPPRARRPRAPCVAAGQGEEPPPRQRVGPWVPVMSLEMGPYVAGGDSGRAQDRRRCGKRYLRGGFATTSPSAGEHVGNGAHPKRCCRAAASSNVRSVTSAAGALIRPPPLRVLLWAKRSLDQEEAHVNPTEAETW
jgi:hypothetical protein